MPCLPENAAAGWKEASSARVNDVMSSPVISVVPETPPKEVAHLSLEHATSGGPGVDDSARLVRVPWGFVLKEPDRTHARHPPLSWLPGD